MSLPKHIDGRTAMRAAAVRVLALALLPCAHAATWRVDDSGTVVGQPVTAMRWRQMAPGRAGDNTVDGRVPIALQLNLAHWLNQPARIYMVMERLQSEQFVAAWRTQGRLLPGQMRSGMRTPVYEGLIRDGLLRETLVMELSADGRTLTRPQNLRFHFEIEVGP